MTARPSPLSAIPIVAGVVLLASPLFAPALPAEDAYVHRVVAAENGTTTVGGAVVEYEPDDVVRFEDLVTADREAFERAFDAAGEGVPADAPTVESDRASDVPGAEASVLVVEYDGRRYGFVIERVEEPATAGERAYRVVLEPALAGLGALLLLLGGVHAAKTTS